MGDDHERLLKLAVHFLQHSKHHPGVFRIQVSRRLVRQNDFRVTDQCPGNSDSLLLPPGERRRFLLQLVLDLQRLDNLIKPMRVESIPLDMLCDGNVPTGRERGKQVESLKNKSDLVATEASAITVAHFGKVVSVHTYASARGGRHASQDMKKRGFATPGGTHDGHEFSVPNSKLHSPQSRHLDLAQPVSLGQIFSFNDRFQTNTRIPCETLLLVS